MSGFCSGEAPQFPSGAWLCARCGGGEGITIALTQKDFTGSENGQVNSLWPQGRGVPVTEGQCVWSCADTGLSFAVTEDGRVEVESGEGRWKTPAGCLGEIPCC